MTKTNILRNTASAATMIIMALAMSAPALATAQGRGQGGKPEDVAAKVTERKEKAEERVEEKRLTMETKTEERLQEACERRVEKLGNSMDRISAQATRLLGVMDSFHEKVEGFYEKGQLTVSNYDELLANVDSAQELATTEIAALGELNVEIDCTDPEVVLSVSSFKGSTSAAKEALREYRKSLVTLISSMRSAAAEDKADTSDDSADTDEADTEETETETDSTDEPTDTTTDQRGTN